MFKTVAITIIFSNNDVVWHLQQFLCFFQTLIE